MTDEDLTHKSILEALLINPATSAQRIDARDVHAVLAILKDVRQNERVADPEKVKSLRDIDLDLEQRARVHRPRHCLEHLQHPSHKPLHLRRSP